MRVASCPNPYPVRLVWHQVVGLVVMSAPPSPRNGGTPSPGSRIYRIYTSNGAGGQIPSSGLREPPPHPKQLLFIGLGVMCQLVVGGDVAWRGLLLAQTTRADVLIPSCLVSAFHACLWWLPRSRRPMDLLSRPSSQCHGQGGHFPPLRLIWLETPTLPCATRPHTLLNHHPLYTHTRF